MKPAKNIEEFVKLEKPHVTTGGEMDKRTLDASFAAMDETIRAGKPNAAGIILRSRTAKLAAAAVILVAVGLLMVYRNPPMSQQQPGTVIVAKSPADMLTAMSLNMAWRRGGIEAVDEQSSRAFKMLESKPAKASIQELLVELNGV
ncbi:MAG: hypothetical protein A2Z38_06235 [Planctomycetes bacterium RBG_19FT_COMBO_48_8]|nr:MAG: hypothetical protein A2Z38_06235 [Planctomycetes bacterium RBG_19FT_COMBO_48_8]